MSGCRTGDAIAPRDHPVAAHGCMKKDSRMKIVTSRIVSALILTSSALASFGCGAASEEELDDPEAEVGTLEQGLTAACGTFAAQTTYTGRVNPTLHATAAQLGAGC